MKHKCLKIFTIIAAPLIFSGCKNSDNSNTSGKYDYNDNKIIANENSHYNVKNFSISPLTNGKTHGKIGSLDGCKDVLEANLQKDTDIALHIKLNADAGKGKLVLVRPNLEVETLAEAIYEKNNKQFENNISIKCISGTNKIKMVGENYSGDFEIYQPNGAIFNNIIKVKNKYKNQDKNDNNMDDSMFGKDFPFEK